MAGCSALLLSILLLLSVTAQAATIPSTAVVANAKIALGQLIASNPGSFIPGFVRLAFHDCVSPKCDACVDLASPDNRGLDARVTALNGLYNSRPDISATMSRADFWMLASVVAVEQGNNGNGVPGLAMRFGRDSSTSCPSSEAGLKFPRAHGNSTETFGFFATNFGFTKSEVVALMGMHSLGRTNAQNTGFTFGPWVINAGTNPTRVIKWVA